MAALYAATHPERTRALVLYAGMARMTGAPGYEWPGRRRSASSGSPRSSPHWGDGRAGSTLIAPERGRRRRAAALVRAARAPRRRARARCGCCSTSPARPTCATCCRRSPCRRSCCTGARTRRSTCATRATSPSTSRGRATSSWRARDNLLVVGDSERVLAEVERFLTGDAHAAGARPRARDRDVHRHRRLDRDGRAPRRPRLARAARAPRRAQPRAARALPRTRGEVARRRLPRDVRRPGARDPLRARLRDAVRELGVELRAGLHTGECEAIGDDVGGLAVHIGARVGALAAPREVLVSSTVKDLVVGSGIDFADRGEHALKGVPGTWRLVGGGRTPSARWRMSERVRHTRRGCTGQVCQCYEATDLRESRGRGRAAGSFTAARLECERWADDSARGAADLRSAQSWAHPAWRSQLALLPVVAAVSVPARPGSLGSSRSGVALFAGASKPGGIA